MNEYLTKSISTIYTFPSAARLRPDCYQTESLGWFHFQIIWLQNFECPHCYQTESISDEKLRLIDILTTHHLLLTYLQKDVIVWYIFDTLKNLWIMCVRLSKIFMKSKNIAKGEFLRATNKQTSWSSSSRDVVFSQNPFWT